MDIRRGLAYTAVFGVLLVEYSFRRAFGVVLAPLSQALGVAPESLSSVPAYFIWATAGGVLVGRLMDRNPRVGLFLGQVISFAGFMAIGLWLSGIASFKILIAVAAIGSMMIGLGLNSFLIKINDFGRTWDLLAIGLARTLAPAMFVVFSLGLFLRGVGASWLFVILAAWQAFFTMVFYLSVRDLSLRKNPSPQKRLIWSWAKKADFWRIVLILSLYESIATIVGISFTSFRADKWIIGAALVGVACRFFWTKIGNTYNTRWPLVAGPLLMALAIIMMPMGGWLTAAGFLVFGFGSSSGLMSFRCYLGDRYGQEEIGVRLGSVFVAYSLAAGLIVSFFQPMLKLFGGFQSLFVFYAVLIVAIVIFFASERNIKWKRPRNGVMEFKKFLAGVYLRR